MEELDPDNLGYIEVSARHFDRVRLDQLRVRFIGAGQRGLTFSYVGLSRCKHKHLFINSSQLGLSVIYYRRIKLSVLLNGWLFSRL